MVKAKKIYLAVGRVKRGLKKKLQTNDLQLDCITWVLKVKYSWCCCNITLIINAYFKSTV